ncbi:hypothetical protein EMIT0P218_30485 [Pseudomonas sp. IT-P218]
MFLMIAIMYKGKKKRFGRHTFAPTIYDDYHNY